MGRKGTDLTGQRFERLVAVRPTEKRQSSRIIWECLCDCGNITYVNSSSLLTGSTRSCGCLCKEISSALGKATRGLSIRDLTGQHFGRLVAMRPIEERQNSHIIWECLCDCGNTHYAMGSLLVCGRVKSCGCLRKDPRKKERDTEDKGGTYVR